MTTTPEMYRILADKTAELRVFEDKKGRMNCSVEDARGALLVVSQSTLFGDARRGRRPNFRDAANSTKAELLYSQFVEQLQSRGLKVKTGVFQTAMQIDLVNYGSVTILLVSEKIF
jgi:D-tyrosyl-tRNA(Tyr) deacylase